MTLHMKLTFSKYNFIDSTCELLTMKDAKIRENSCYECVSTPSAIISRPFGPGGAAHSDHPPSSLLQWLLIFNWLFYEMSSSSWFHFTEFTWKSDRPDPQFSLLLEENTQKLLLWLKKLFFIHEFLLCFQFFFYLLKDQRTMCIWAEHHHHLTWSRCSHWIDFADSKWDGTINHLYIN